MRLLDELRDRIAAHARPGLSTPIDGLLLSRVTTVEPYHVLTEPLLIIMAQGGKRLMLGDAVFEYRSGQYLIVTAELAVTGHFLRSDAKTPSLAVGMRLRPAAIAALLLRAPAPRRPRTTTNPSVIATGAADVELLDALVRMVRLLDRPCDIPVLAPLIEQEILWRLLTGPHADMIGQIGRADSELNHIGRAISWIRENYAEPMQIADLAGLAQMSASTFHRHFRAITAMSPLQFQKHIRLQEARALLVAKAGDVAGIGHLVGYDSPTQFNREYRRQFGLPPGQDAARLRTGDGVADGHRLP